MSPRATSSPARPPAAARGTPRFGIGFTRASVTGLCVLLNAAAASAQFMDLPRPVAIMGDEFVGPPAPEPGLLATLWPTIWISLIAIGAVTSLAAIIRFWVEPHAPAEQAMLGMSLQLRLRRGDRAVLRHLAGFSAAGTDLGLLLSEEAFAAALARCERESGGVDPAAAARVRARVFG